MSFIVPEARRTVHPGQRFTRYLILGVPFYAETGDRWRESVACECDCGSLSICFARNLTCGISRSCGCYRRDTIIKATTTQNMRHTRLYEIWSAMKGRCTRSSHKSFGHYGDRGISLCDEWMDFVPFMRWALSNGYSDELTIDRIDNDGSYEPLNCRWASAFVQQNNRRCTLMIRAFNETKPVMDWVRDERCVVSRQVLIYRFFKSGWDGNNAVSMPAQAKGVKRRGKD